MEDGVNLSCEISLYLTWIQGISEVRLLIHPRFQNWCMDFNSLLCHIQYSHTINLSAETALFCLLTLLCIIMHICLWQKLNFLGSLPLLWSFQRKIEHDDILFSSTGIRILQTSFKMLCWKKQKCLCVCILPVWREMGVDWNHWVSIVLGNLDSTESDINAYVTEKQVLFTVFLAVIWFEKTWIAWIESTCNMKKRK